MNSQAARTMRRHGVITTLDTQAEAIGALNNRIGVWAAVQEQTAAELRRRLDTQDQAIADLRMKLAYLQDQPVLTRLTFTERLRWLWRGR